MSELLHSPSQDQYYLKDEAGTRPVKVFKSESTGKTFIDTGDGQLSEYKAEEAYSPSAYDYGQQVIGQGALMGGGDEIAGFGKGLYDYATTDKGFKDSIYDRIDAERAQMAKTEEALGFGKTLALQAGGGLLTGGYGAGRAIAAKGLTLGAKALRGGAQGAVQGGITGAGMAEGGVLDRAGAAGQGAATGALLGPLLTGAGHAVGKGLSSAGRMLPSGAKRQAHGLLQATVPQKAVSRMERDLAKMPKGVLADVAPKDAQRLSGEAMRTIGGGREVEILAARHKGQAARLVPKVDEIVSPHRVDDMMKGLAKQRQASASKDYQAVYDAEVPLTDTLKSFFRKDAAQEAWSGAQKLADFDGVKLPPLFTVLPNGSKQYAKPTAKMMDYIKQSMDDMVNDAYKSTGRKKYAARLQQERDSLREHLDDLIPGYRDARGVYAGYSAAIEAAENGANFMRSSFGDELSGLKGLMTKADLDGMGEHELEAFRAGVASVLRDKITGKGFGADVTKLFDSPKAVDKLKSALGPKGASAFLNEVRKEAKMAATWAENQGSQTGQRASASASMGRPAAALADAAISGSPVGVLGGLRQAANAVAPPPEAVAKHISRLMASPRTADKMEAFKMLKGGAVQRPLGQLGGYAQGAASGLGGYLGGKFGANF